MNEVIVSQKKRKNGFTLVELLIGLSVISLIIPIVFSLFFLVLQSKAKILILQEVKKNGDYTLSTMQYFIKNRAIKIYNSDLKTNEVCTTASGFSTPSSSDYVYFADADDNLFYFQLASGKVASYSAVISPNPQYLTNTKTTVSNLTITFSRSSTFSPPIVSVSFTVTNPPSAVKHEEKATLNYQTKIKLRNYLH